MWLKMHEYLKNTEKTRTGKSLEQFSNIHLTLSPLNLTKYYSRKCKNWPKSEYAINTRPIHVRNCCPGSITGVAWYGWARDWCARGPGFDSG